ncbi:hypothetical protein ACFXKC_31820 [Streptomyces sp. NPDC059340]|uniref:hypothetical protein n=1 Tax=unclassified Streptomyces TaxID=2593676 RepID=UPI00143E524D|nr:hypothetical protein [Streptomyces sp. S1D4-11]QIY98765.1 hypothetical protein HEP87_38385 [Streptomyces sp. S1D4-11]
MTGSTPPWKRRFPSRAADEGPSDGPEGVRDDERGSSRPGSASLERAPATAPTGAFARAGEVMPADDPEPSDDSVPADVAVPATGRRAAGIRDGVRKGVQKGGSRAKAGLSHLADRIIEIAPRVPVRDLATLRRQFPGLTPEQLADKLVAGAANATSTVGAGIGAAAMLPVPPAMPTELAAEITGVAAIELKLIAELHEVYGLRPPGNLKQRSTGYLNSWSSERGIDVTKPSTINAALGGQMKRELRQQIMKRMVRDLPNLMPFMVGAAVGAVMNRRDTKRLAARIRKDLRKSQVPWDALAELPPLEKPADPLRMGEIPKELGH